MSIDARQDLAPRVPNDGLKGRGGTTYFADPDLVTAANVALAIRRPLLLTGEPGCGKTEFAWALAGALKLSARTTPYECHVRSDSRARDLLYHHDALRRFADASHGNDAERERARDVRNYVSLLPLGEALAGTGQPVVLIDEIDKAPRDLPNDLLRELDQGSFEIPEIPEDAKEPGLVRKMGRSDDSRPFVLITSNVERQLPDPFLRRCVFFHIAFPNADTLKRIVRDRVGGRPIYLDTAVRLFTSLRDVKGLSKRPATSELVDWVSALDRVFDPREVETRLAVVAKVAEEVRDLAEVPWRSLPAFSCLIKLREDQERLPQVLARAPDSPMSWRRSVRSGRSGHGITSTSSAGWTGLRPEMEPSSRRGWRPCWHGTRTSGSGSPRSLMGVFGANSNAHLTVFRRRPSVLQPWRSCRRRPPDRCRTVCCPVVRGSCCGCGLSAVRC